MNNAKLAQERRLRTVQVISALYSVLFVAAIGYGYFVLVPGNHFVGTLAACVIAGIAWNIARFIGGHERGIVTYAPLFILLLIISAVGVFNTLMLNLESRQIFSETIETANTQFTELESSARKYLVALETEKRINKVQALKDALIAEIKNPLNCGQGTKAREIMAELQSELPQFTPLNVPNIDCRQNDRLAEEYEKKIMNDVEKTPWYIESRYSELRLDKNQILENVSLSRQKLQEMRLSVSSSSPLTLLSEGSPMLKELGVTYSESVERLHRHTQSLEIPRTIDLALIESLGQWSQLINLLLARLDVPSTYVYLSIAVFADWMMVYLFGLVRQSKTNTRPRSLNSNSLSTPWQ